MEELKPCPFCGGKAEKRINIEDDTVQICCTKCECRLGSKHQEWESGFGRLFYDNEFDAIDAWNRRVK